MSPHQRPVPAPAPTTPKPNKSRLRWLAVFSSVLLLVGYVMYRMVLPVFVMSGTKSTFTQVVNPSPPGGTAPAAPAGK